jgi:hypothetical protein
MDNETYLFHQTPAELAKILIQRIDLLPNDLVLEPFKGEGSFYNNFPDTVVKDWCELEEGRDYKDYVGNVDWVISNPPFKLEEHNGKRVNSFFYLINYYASRVNKGIAFLGNDTCFSTLTPLRLKELQEKYNLYIHNIISCNVKKWRGRYFFIVFKKGECPFYQHVIGSY